MPSIIAEIGEVIERHLIDIGMLKSNEPDEAQARLIEEKKADLRAEHAASGKYVPTADGSAAESDTEAEEPWMANATHCAKCNNKAVVLRDGCQTCMNCGDSKCG